MSPRGTTGVDEDDVRIRPGRSGSRPRTKRRPGHEDAGDGLVIAVDRGRYTCVSGDHTILAMAARELGRRSIVVGDRVRIVGDQTGDTGSLARIVRVQPRATALRRTADDDDPTERVVVANAEQLVIVTALADPPPRTGLIDRALVAAFAGGLTPVLCLTKTDLASPDALLASYSALDLPVVTSRYDEEPAGLRGLLAGRTSVLLGHSGVGKSTLVNRLVPDAMRAVGVVSGIGRGRHTSSSVVALRLPDGGWIIDTPGIRSFGLAHVGVDDLLRAFPDLNPATVDCPRGCDHRAGAPDCGLDKWVRRGCATPERLESYRRLADSLRDN